MRYYETLVVLKYDISDDMKNEIISKIESAMKKDDGEILKAEDWGKTSLAYKIDRDEYGIYKLWHFLGSETVPDELDKYCRIADGIIRFQTIQMYKKDIDSYTKPAVEDKKEAVDVSEATETDEDS